MTIARMVDLPMWPPQDCRKSAGERCDPTCGSYVPCDQADPSAGMANRRHAGRVDRGQPPMGEEQCCTGVEYAHGHPHQNARELLILQWRQTELACKSAL